MVTHTKLQLIILEDTDRVKTRLPAMLNNLISKGQVVFSSLFSTITQKYHRSTLSKPEVFKEQKNGVEENLTFLGSMLPSSSHSSENCIYTRHPGVGFGRELRLLKPEQDLERIKWDKENPILQSQGRQLTEDSFRFNV